VLDVGCGRGQFGILLHELGRAQRVTGFDWDERKIAAARAASPQAAAFAVGDARAAELPRSDTILALDVLHYLTIAEQSALLARLAASVAPGGQLLIRDVDERGTSRSRLTRWFERVATRIGYNRAASLHFRTADELVAELSAHGLTCSVERERATGPLANVLIIARRDGEGDAADRHSARTSTLTEP
jgi:2-polyprenyl-3-methyl-5-hydroxy-6-metoxy-1,4-benzoquinol methylase